MHRRYNYTYFDGALSTKYCKYVHPPTFSPPFMLFPSSDKARWKRNWSRWNHRTTRRYKGRVSSGDFLEYHSCTRFPLQFHSTPKLSSTRDRAVINARFILNPMYLSQKANSTTRNSNFVLASPLMYSLMN